MDERIEKWLYDILLAIEEIESYFADGERDFIRFQQTPMLKRAVERNLEIIGEATKRILARDTNIAISSARKIVDLRNFVIHSYDSLSDDIVWAVVINNLPKLKTEVTTIINNSANQLLL